MSREIKFRVWSFQINKWVDDHFLFHEAPLDLKFTLQNCFYELDGEKDAFSVQQFTGLKDKNGVDIYEGDIIVYFSDNQLKDNRIIHEPSYEIKEVIWNDGGFAVDIEDDIFLGKWLDISKTEILGNIHENPELIKD